MLTHIALQSEHSDARYSSDRLAGHAVLRDSMSPMATRNLSLQDFDSTVDADGIVILDFWAAWCGPCRSFAPIFEQASERHPDIVFGKIDTEAERELAAMAQITSIPTLMVFRDGIGVFSQPGALPAPAVESLIEQVRALDMDEVRAQIAAEDAAS